MEIIPEFMHMLKHDWEITFVDLFKKIVKPSENWCPFIHDAEKNTDFSCYQDNPGIIKTINFLENLHLLFDYLELGEFEINFLDESINELKFPHKNKTWKSFNSHLDNLIQFLENISPIAYKKIKKFTCLESQRIWESIRCFGFRSYYASTVLIVSALESRLRSLIRNKSPDLYNKEIRNFTLGKIITLRDPEEYKEEKYREVKDLLNKIIPEKHTPLMKLLNYYRVLSAHPSLETISKNLAKSIINLSFAFLLDESLQIPNELCSDDGHAPAE